MEARVRQAVAQCSGLITRCQLVELGLENRTIDRLVRHQVLRTVRRGVFTTPEHWASLGEYDGRPLLEVRAARLTMNRRHVLSHDSAALVHALPLIDSPSSLVHFSREDLRATRHRAGVVQHGAKYLPQRVRLIEGLPVLDVPRTVCDLARFHGYREGLIAADAALHGGLPRADLQAVLTEMRTWPFSLTAAAVIADADPGAESAGETLARELVMEAGLGPIETQFPVAHEGGVFWCDLRVGRHVIEFNGRIKYRSPEEGGLSRGDLERQLWAERKREREICAPGLGLSQLIWADFWGGRREQAILRLQEAHRSIVQRFGTELPPEMAEFAARVRGQRVRVG